MDTRDLLTIIGWPISCLLSIIAGGLIIPRLTKKRKVLAWDIVSQICLISDAVQKALSLPITIQIDGHSPKSISLVRLRIGNAGNEVIDNATGKIQINKNARILYIKSVKNLGEFAKHIKFEPNETDKTTAIFQFDYINPGFIVDFEMLLCDYKQGEFDFDSTGPGIEVRRQETNNWNLSRHISLFSSIGLSWFGMRYDPSVSCMADIANELKAIRRKMTEKK